MARRGKRVLLAPNIFADDTGVSVKVTVGGHTRERRYPAGTPLAHLEAVRDELRGLQQAARPAPAGTLRADVLAYLKTIEDGRKKRDMARLLAHWVAAYGQHSRFVLNALLIKQQLVAWRQAGAAASSCNHRLQALRNVFKAVNGPDEPNPAAQVPRLSPPPAEPRAQTFALIARILAALPDRGRPSGKGKGTRPKVSLTKLRLTFWAYSGLPPAQIGRINPATDILWDVPALRARPRRKGKGTKETWLPLMPQAVAALKALVAVGALPGHFSTGSMYKTFQRAVRKIRKDDPTLPHIRPYDVRHTYASAALAASNDIAAVQHLLQHSTPAMTTRYTLAAVPAGAARAAALLADRLGAPLPPGETPGHRKDEGS